jgi:hypothetical protein
VVREDVLVGIVELVGGLNVVFVVALSKEEILEFLGIELIVRT